MLVTAGRVDINAEGTEPHPLCMENQTFGPSPGTPESGAGGPNENNKQAESETKPGPEHRTLHGVPPPLFRNTVHCTVFPPLGLEIFRNNY